MIRKWLRRCWLGVSLPCTLNLLLCMSQMEYLWKKIPAAGFLRGFLLSAVIVVLAVQYVCLLTMPAKDWRGSRTGLRVRMMLGGGRLVYCGLYTMAVQIWVFCRFYISSALLVSVGPVLLTVNAVLACAGCFLLLADGVLRMICTSRRLGIVRRAVMVFIMWIPVVNVVVLLYACRLIREEYDFEWEKAKLRELRVDSEICRTRYPLVMVHGIGFRDLRYFNYWGRIPGELKRNGATVYYGNQEALGTIVYNAEDIRKRILQIREETGCEKVNVIAHSKGGLDARYAISKLGMAPYVASLTTMNTPHRGCRFVDYACGLPDGLYRLVACYFDRTFSRLGDRNPDFYTATHQFSTRESERFNQQVPDALEVYYQSYTSKMKHPWSHLLLCIPYCMIRPLEGDNDGLVSVNSAKWGEFQGIFSNVHTRGISHGDIIDLKREDYKGFDVTETYVQIVSRLREKGF